MAYLSCLRDSSGHDPYCYHSFSFDKNHFSSSEQQELTKYWPKIGGKKNFWSYEWDKHGTCYLHIIKDEYSSTSSTKDLFRQYFLKTIEKVKELKLKMKKGDRFNSKSSLAKALNLHSSQFYAICYRDNELD